jgi:hypothetical protein
MTAGKRILLALFAASMLMQLALGAVILWAVLR